MFSLSYYINYSAIKTGFSPLFLWVKKKNRGLHIGFSVCYINQKGEVLLRGLIGAT